MLSGTTAAYTPPDLIDRLIHSGIDLLIVAVAVAVAVVAAAAAVAAAALAAALVHAGQWDIPHILAVSPVSRSLGCGMLRSPRHCDPWSPSMPVGSCQGVPRGIGTSGCL